MESQASRNLLTSSSIRRKQTNPPEHLSEFFSLMSNSSDMSLQQGKSSTQIKYSGSSTSPATPKISASGQHPRRPSLNTIDTFTSFSPSVLDLPNILTSKDFLSTVETYGTLLERASNLKKALDEVSRCTGEFGQALEDCVNDCPKVQNSRPVEDGMINAGGLHYMISSNQQILGRLIEQSFEIPLKRELLKLKEEYQVNHTYYQQEIKSRSRVLRESELQNLKLSKLKTRNLTSYKNNLMDLTRQVEEIDRLKYGYYREINLMLERFNQEKLLPRTGSLVRAQLELYEGIAKKGWSGGGLDNLLAVSPDLFAEEDEEEGIDDVMGKNRYGLTEDNRNFPLTGNINSLREEPLNEADEGDDSAIFEADANETMETVKLTDDLPSGHKYEPNTDGSSTPIPTKSRNNERFDSSMDESFSLPVVNNSNSLLARNSGHDTPEGSILNDDILKDL